jgi:hypothetical protein
VPWTIDLLFARELGLEVLQGIILVEERGPALRDTTTRTQMYTRIEATADVEGVDLDD